MKKFKKPVKKPVSELRCDVPKCTREMFAGWQPQGRPDKNLRVCTHHYHRDKDPDDSFSLWDIAGISKPPKIRYRRKTDDASKKKKSGRKGGFKAALYKLLDEKGATKVRFAEAKKLADSINPDNKLSKGHFKWYVKGYKKQ